MNASLLAIFVGGRSRRMGRPKGLLSVPGQAQSIVEVLVAVGREVGLEPILVGDATPYRDLVPDVGRLEDDPPGGGPLAGLRAAVRHARTHERERVVSVACDMPFVSTDALTALISHRSDAAIVAPRRGRDAPWEPMLARYDAGRVADVLDEALARGTRSFQALFARLEVDSLPLTPAIERALSDWDTPGDVHR